MSCWFCSFRAALQTKLHVFVFWHFCLHVQSFSGHVMQMFIFHAINKFWRFCMCQTMTSWYFCYILQKNEMSLTRTPCINEPGNSSRSVVNTPVPNRNLFRPFIKQASHTYCGRKRGVQDKAWAPHMAWKSCTKNLRCGEYQYLPAWKSCPMFGIPTVSRELTNHVGWLAATPALLTRLGSTEAASTVLILNQHVFSSL